MVLQTVPGHHRRPRERRRRRIRPAVELQGQGRERRRQHVEHRRHRDHGHGRDRVVADLLRLRHVPGDAGHDGRRGSAPTRRRACSSTSCSAAAPTGGAASGRYYYENNDLQSDNVSSALAGTLQSYNRIEYYKDYGVEGGGPIVADRLWAWGAYGKTNPAMEIYTYARPSAALTCPDGTRVQGCGAAASAHDVARMRSRRATARTSRTTRPRSTASSPRTCAASFTYFRGNKKKFGRGASADPSGARPPGTRTGPTDMFKGEVNYTMSNSTFLTGRYAYTGGGFSLRAGRRPQRADGARTTTRIWQNSYLLLRDRSPAAQRADRRQLLPRRARVQVRVRLPQGLGRRPQSGCPGGVLTIYDGYPDMIAQVTRDCA